MPQTSGLIVVRLWRGRKWEGGREGGREGEQSNIINT
jgi:hypothetical protein